MAGKAACGVKFSCADIAMLELRFSSAGSIPKSLSVCN